MTPVGGLRARFIKDSLFKMVNQALDDLGWFDTNRRHLPIRFVDDGIDDNSEVTLNTLVLDDDDIDDDEDELGSNYSEHRWTMYLDFYAENKPLGIHVSQDLKSILEGRMPSIGRSNSFFDVYNYDQATPTVVGACEIENVRVGRARNFPQRWKRNWYSVQFTVVDWYGDEDD